MHIAQTAQRLERFDRGRRFGMGARAARRSPARFCSPSPRPPRCHPDQPPRRASVRRRLRRGLPRHRRGRRRRRVRRRGRTVVCRDGDPVLRSRPAGERPLRVLAPALSQRNRHALPRARRAEHHRRRRRERGPRPDRHRAHARACRCRPSCEHCAPAHHLALPLGTRHSRTARKGKKVLPLAATAMTGERTTTGSPSGYIRRRRATPERRRFHVDPEADLRAQLCVLRLSRHAEPAGRPRLIRPVHPPTRWSTRPPVPRQPRSASRLETHRAGCARDGLPARASSSARSGPARGSMPLSTGSRSAPTRSSLIHQMDLAGAPRGRSAAVSPHGRLDRQPRIPAPAARGRLQARSIRSSSATAARPRAASSSASATPIRSSCREWELFMHGGHHFIVRALRCRGAAATASTIATSPASTRAFRPALPPLLGFSPAT